MGFVLLLALAVLASILPASARLVKDPEDLRAFYCAGKLVAAHMDPYIAGPIRACENREIRAAGMTPFAGLALPAPLPIFALLPFSALAALPFPLASTLYILLLIVAMAASAILIARIANFPIPATIATLLLSDGLITILNGQVFPFAMLALCASAYEVTRGRHRSASIYAAFASIEPHVALPALVSLAWSLPRTRWTLAISLATLAVAALAVAGIQENLEYLFRVLPAHARSESTAGGQYSLTSLLFHAGLSRERAIFIGNVQYAAMCAIGIAVARRLVGRFDAPELYVLVPPAFALLGGPFIHLTQMAVAVPALLALANRIPAQRNFFGAALLLIAIPWQDLVENETIMIIGTIALVGSVIALTFWRTSYRIAGLAIMMVLALGMGERALRLAYPPLHADPERAIAAVAQPDRLAEATWEVFIDQTQRGNTGRYLAARAPTWLAIVMLVSMTTLAASSCRQLESSA